MKTILVPLDGSSCAEQVLPYVRLLAPLLNARIHLLRVLPATEPTHRFAESFAVMAGAFPAGSSAITHRTLNDWTNWTLVRLASIALTI